MRRILELLRLRNSNPAFQGRLSVSGEGPRLRMTWVHGAESLGLEVDLATAAVEATDGTEPIAVVAG